jgi:hypothetical protein
MIGPTGIGEIVRFNPDIHTTVMMQERRLLAVATTLPTRRLYPGIQTAVSVRRDGPDLASTGLIAGDRQLRTAAGRILQQFAYFNGLPPGHAGLHHALRSDLLVSGEVKERIRNTVTGSYIGYLCFTDARRFDPPVEQFGDAGSLRSQLDVQEIVGLTAADVSALVDPGGIDALRDPVEHPVVREDLALVGLRPEILGPTQQ